MKRVLSLLLFLALCGMQSYASSQDVVPFNGTQAISLDGRWSLSIDPNNVGRQQQWWKQPTQDARPTNVPWVIQDVFPDYHGVVWYWRNFDAPRNPHDQGRYLIRFWNVDYTADVWVNDKYVGSHEGADGVFVLDATDAVKAGQSNRLAVRVLNPKDEPIDGIVLGQTPHRNKTCAYTFGCDYNHGGIEDSVELLVTPAVLIEDIFAQPDSKTGIVRIQLTVSNTLKKQAGGRLEVSVAPATGGETVQSISLDRKLPVGSTIIETEVPIKNARLWDLNDPYMYRVTARLSIKGKTTFDERSARCGFRDFRVDNGYFRLNGKRLFLRCSHTGNTVPIGIHVPYDKDLFRRDLINVKMMGFNAIRFIAGGATPYQLDLCDEIGLLVYEEAYSAWLLADSNQMARRFDEATAGMIRRDRNHPSLVIWGVLNETGDGPVFEHAVKTLPLVRSLDPGRLVLLSSGRFDCRLNIGSVANPESSVWQCLLGDEREVNAPTGLKTIYPSPQGAGDAHLYPQVPHCADAINLLRTYGQGGKGVFVSEYGVASAVNLERTVRQYEQRGKGSCGEAKFYRQALDQFYADWERWNMTQCFGRPQEYFEQCIAQMAKQRLLGINALRGNPSCIGYSLTGTVDQGYSGEGLTTVFRELKPGTVDAIFESFAPLRWCLFVEPMNVYRGTKVKLEAVLANEDVLRPGEYPVRFEVFSSGMQKVFSRTVTVKIADRGGKSEPAFSLPVFAEEIATDWPSDSYRFTATFERDGSPAGGTTEFYVTDVATMPAVETEVVLWGEDAELAGWLGTHGIKVKPFADSSQKAGEVILVPGNDAGTDKAGALRDLTERISQGAHAIFLCPQIFDQNGVPAAMLQPSGKLSLVTMWSTIYHKDEWAKRHPIFDGLPAGGILDTAYYREVLSPLAWVGQSTPAEAVAGAIHAQPSYSSGLQVAVYKLGQGRFILNTLHIRENLGKHPAAERLLRNMLRYAAQNVDKPQTDVNDSSNKLRDSLDS